MSDINDINELNDEITVENGSDSLADPETEQIENEIPEMTDEADTSEAEASLDGSETEESSAASEAEDSTGFVGDSSHELVFSNNPGSIPDAGEKASKKTTAVLISIIVVLVAVIVVFGVLIFKQISEEKKAQKEAEALAQVTPEVKNDDVYVGSDQVVEAREYDVTVELGEYKGIEVDYELSEVSDVDVANEIAYFLDSFSEEQEVTDRPVQNGDVAYIDFVGYIDGEEFEGGSGTNYDLEIGSGSFIPGFEDALIGAMPGDIVNVDINFPDPYPNSPDLAGSPVLFVVTINSVTEFVVPELTDDFVSENTEFETAQEYARHVREELEENAASEAREKAESAVMETVINNSTFGGDIEEEIDFNTEQYLAYFDSMAQAYYGIDGATLYAYMYGLSGDEYREMMRENVGYSIKYQYVLDAVAEKENMTVSAEEFDEQFNEYFIESYGYLDKAEVLEDMKNEYPDDDPETKLAEIVNQLVLRDKAEKFLLGNAVINE